MGIGAPAGDSEQYRSAFDDACAGMMILAVDGSLVRVNPELCRMTGRSEAELLAGAGLETLVPGDERDAVGEQWRRALADGTSVIHADRRYLRAEGAVGWARLTLAIVRGAEGEPTHAVGQLIDITDRCERDTRLERIAAQQGAVATLGQLALTARLADDLAVHAVRGIADAISADVLAIAREDERSGQLMPVAGIDRGAIGTPLPDLRHARCAMDDGAPVVVEDRDSENRFDVDDLRGRGLRSGVALPVLCADGDPGVLAVYRRLPGAFDEDELSFLDAMVAVLNGAVIRLQGEDELLRQSLYDAVTDVPNRRFLLATLGDVLAGRRADRPLSIISFGLVNRRTVHESLGHDAGDRFLREIGQRIAMLLTLDETLARSDGDEFVVISPELDCAEQAIARVRDLLSRVRGPVSIEGLDLPPHLVAGVVLADPSARPRPEDLVRDASAAMYRAMAEDVGIAVFDEAMRAETVERLSLLDELRRAIETRALHLAYQPIVSRSAGRVTKFEALVRWAHPVRGQIPPDRFVPLAESHGLIGRLGHFVLTEALDQVSHWRASGDTLGDRQMNVNISRAQLDDPGLVAEILGALEERDLQPSSLVIEVTESALAEDGRAAQETVRALSAAGIGIALDDFGVGQSSLASLTELPLDVLKLDRSLVQQVGESHERIAIMSAVAQIASALDLEVVAEGIENPDEAELTERLGCDLGQGWFYARPTASEDLPAVVAALDGALWARRAAPEHRAA